MRKALHIFLYFLGGILTVLFIVIVWLNTGPGKRFVKNKIVAYLQHKLKTEIHIGEFDYGLPKYISIKNVLFKDQHNDTLLYAGKMVVNINMLQLISGDIDVQQLTLEHIYSHVYRNAPDTNFNFTYIVNAFAGKEEKQPKDTSASTTTINVNKVLLNDIHIRFDDVTGGTKLAVDLQHLELTVKKLDLQEMGFHLKTLQVNGLQTVFLQDTSYLAITPDTSTKKAALKLVADDIDLKEINFKYSDELSKFLMDLHLGDLKTEVKSFDLAHEKVNINNLDLNNTSVKIVLGKQLTAPEKANSVADTLPPSKWRVAASALKLNNIRFIFDDDNTPPQQYGMDYAHIDVKNLALNAQDILYTADSILGDVRHLAATEKSGFDLIELKTVFAYHPQGAYLRNLYLQTSNTLLHDYISVVYPSLDTLKQHLEMLVLDADLQKSYVGLSDVLIFAPQLREQELFRKYYNQRLQLDAVLKGRLDDLAINQFHLSGLQNTSIQLNGKLRGLPDVNKINYALNIQKLQSSYNDLDGILPPSLKKQVRIPDRFSAVGSISGNVKDYKTNLVVASTDGNATLKGYIYMSAGKGKERYDLSINTKALNIGHILRKDSLIGAITTVLNAKGSGFDVNSMNASVQGDIHSAGFMGYNYSNINFDGSIAEKLANLSLVSADTNAMLQLQAKVNFTEKDPALNAILNIDSADLQALKLYKDEMRIRATIDADFPELNAAYPNGVLVIDKPVVTTKGQRYFLDSLYISSKPSTDSGQNIIVNADAILAKITGKTPLSEIGNIIQEHISRHYKAKNDSTQNAKPLPSYDLAIKATIQDRPLLHAILPGLQSMDTVRIDATLDPRKLYVDVDIPHVVYNGLILDKGKAAINGTDSALTYAVTLNNLAMSNMQLWYAKAEGKLQGEEITANISIGDSAKKERFVAHAVLQQNDDEQLLQLKEGLVLNYKTWQVSQPNKIAFSKKGFYAQNFSISNGGESISINSEPAQYNSALNISIDNFLLSNITEIVQKDKDTVLANGVLNSKLKVKNITTAPQAEGTLQIQNLSVFNDTIGNLNVELKEASANEVDAKITLNGNSNDIVITGSFYPKPLNNNNFNLKLAINSLNLKSIEALTQNQLRNSSGFVKGDLAIKGTATSPSITGDIRTDKLTTTVSMLGSAFTMPNERIAFTPEGITFDNFKILDSLGNKGVITGNIATRNYRDMEFNMNVKSKKWQVLNSTAQDNKLFYGKLVISTNLDIKGTPMAPAIDGKLTIHDTTNFIVAIPEKNRGIEERKGIVEFIDVDAPDRNAMLMPKDTVQKLAMRTGAKLDVNIAIEENAEFGVLVDQATGDFLRVRGEAALNTTINPDGTIGLTGTYELKQGAYQLNYNLIKRKFDIQPGSTIMFAGDPLQAELDITAAYTANVAPYDLVQKEVSQPEQLNYFKQSLPFDVELKLKGVLLKPDITFDIVLPEEKKYRVSSDVTTLVQGKLSQLRNNPSELNKQVFALLILNRFVSENPFESGSGGNSAEFIARQSASRLLSEQLNALATRMVNGLEVNLDLESSKDYTSGEQRNRTDLNISASKRLLNDRLTVTVGNNFELEGQSKNNNQNTSLVPGNLAADYQLTSDGRYMVRIYRKDEMQDIVEGYVVETGVSFIVTVEYNRFKQLFNKRRKDTENDKKKKGVSN